MILFLFHGNGGYANALLLLHCKLIASLVMIIFLSRREKKYVSEPILSIKFIITVLSTIPHVERLRWSRGSVLAFGTHVGGFKPGRSRRIFQVEKILSTPSFGREVKPFVPCRRFTACKRSLNVTWKSYIFRQNSSAISRPSSSSFHYKGL